MVHDSALCAGAMGKHDSMKSKKGSNTAQGRRPMQRFKSATQEAIQRQFMALACFSAIQASFDDPKFENTGEIVPAGSTPFKILKGGKEGRAGGCRSPLLQMRPPQGGAQQNE